MDLPLSPTTRQLSFTEVYHVTIQIAIAKEYQRVLDFLHWRISATNSEIIGSIKFMKENLQINFRVLFNFKTTQL